MWERPARLIFFHCVASSFRAAPTRRTAPSCNNQTVPHLLWPTEENLFLPLGSLSYYFFFFFYMTMSYFVFTLIWGLNFACEVFFLAEGTGFFSYSVLFCIFKLCYCMCAVLMLILYPALLAHIHTLHTHTDTKSFIDQCLCFDPSWGFTFNGQAVNTQHAQLVNPVRSRSPQPHRRQENVCLSCLSPIR